MNKKTFIQDLRSKIDIFGYRITYVMTDINLRFAYTIGLSEKYTFEVVFAGGAFYLRGYGASFFNGFNC
jgi:hypothetical protein